MALAQDVVAVKTFGPDAGAGSKVLAFRAGKATWTVPVESLPVAVVSDGDGGAYVQTEDPAYACAASLEE